MNGRYPEGYNGPKSGVSTPEEWALVRDYQAYKWIIDGTWNYSDFDNYLYSMAKMLADKIITYENLSK